MQTRKPLRLKGYDYATSGAYFVTVCTRNKSWLFGENDSLAICAPVLVERDPCVPPPIATQNDSRVNMAREIISHWIDRIPSKFPNWTVDKWVVMPNHIHLIVEKENILNSVLSNDIRSFKTLVTKEVGFQIWQSSFYDHIIRDDYDYNVHLQYINDNPIKWCEDKYYCG